MTMSPQSTTSADTAVSVAQTRNFIDGEFVDGVKTFDNISPVDGTVVSQVHEADALLVDRAVTAARRALSGPWGRFTVNERVALLRRIADRIEARFEDLLAAEVGDTGKPESVARGLDVARAAANFRAFADVIGAHTTDARFMDLPTGGQALNYTVDKPVGVVAVIVPWNLPLLLLTWKVAPALACGNAVVVKPSEETPSSATVLAEVLAEAGVPEGVYNLVHGFGPGSAGEALTTHRGIDAVTFTGETRTGAAIMAAVAPGVKPVSFELGGKNAGLVFADADLPAAIAGVARSTFANTGQVCLCTERVYVQRPVYDEFMHRLTERTKQMKVGNPAERDVYVGPVVDEKAVERFETAVASAKGGTVRVGGERLAGGDYDHGTFVAPTVIDGLPTDHVLFKQELFLPLVVAAPVDSLDQAIDLANDTEYGLTAGIFTEDKGEIRHFFDRIEAGVVYANRKGGSTTGAWPGCQSFAGWKASGSTGKGGLGPYYVQQFLREQSQTIVTDSAEEDVFAEEKAGE